MGEGSPLAWIAAWVPFALVCVLSAGATDTANTAEAAGALFGAVVIALLIGLFLRWAVLKLSRSSGPVWSPWVLVIGTVVTLLSLAGRAQP